MGVHSENHCIQVSCNLFGKPTCFFWQETPLFQPGGRRFKDGIVRTRNPVSFFVQGDGKIVHGVSANGNKLYFLHQLKTSWRSRSSSISSRGFTFRNFEHCSLASMSFSRI